MVMKRNAMRKNLRQSIIKSFGRYIAIVAIIALGSGLFMGLLMTKTDMIATGQIFTDEQNMFDLRLINSYGWTDEYVKKIEQIEGIEDAEGMIYLDLIARTGETADDAVYRFYSIPEKINQVALRGGRMPEAYNECLADGFYADDSILGQTITISETNDENSLDSVRYRTFTIVGYVASPLYMDMNRGTTSVGSGSLSNYYYIPQEAFDVDYYTEINITIPGDYAIYSDVYNDTLETAADTLEPEIEKLAQQRFYDVKMEAEEQYADGYQEYLDAVREYEEGKAEAEKELADAYQKLLDAEEKLKSSRITLLNSEDQLRIGWEQLNTQKAEFSKSKAESEQTKAVVLTQIEEEEKALDQKNAELSAEYEEILAGIETVETSVEMIKAEIHAGMDMSVEQIEETIASLDERIVSLEKMIASSEGTEAEKLKKQLDDLNAYRAQMLQCYAPYEQLITQLNKLCGQRDQIKAGLDEIQAGYDKLSAQKIQLEEAEAQLIDGEQKIAAAEAELNAAQDEIDRGWVSLRDGEAELEDGWVEYEEGKLEAEEELADAEVKLADASQELADARADIDSLEPAELYILNRTSNIGYNSLDSSSDIVQGVSRVFPVFFLLVASLVCITTMTRMIEEERTQIGTLKALGYSNSAIIGKYMVYSGSGALLGCGLGVIVGSAVFPMILWQAYCIMLYIQPKVVLTMDWPLCIAVVIVYTVVLLFVTWYCCRRALREEPAELIRPKAPEAGKKILVEYLPFWHKISFLNKVTIRNIFRYRQRLAMMLVGIGGCTALLVTGFGLRDSIVNVVDYQFEDVTFYDLQVYFNDGMTDQEKEEFQTEISDQAEDILFYHQSSVDLEFEGRTRGLYLIAAEEELNNFIDFHSGEEKIPMPGLNEVVLSIGVAEAMGIEVGDSVILRNSDMETLELTVSGIYENHVYNYSIVLPGTLEEQWGETPDEQMAFVKASEGQRPHELGAFITDMDNVMNVSVSEDLADMVRNMMEALDMVVVLIVFCAGLLAVIVLYNLTNININERIREIATIKVLGFNASETGAYVFKENLALTVAGSALGLILGKLLLNFVMSQIKIDMVWFKALVEPQSYLWAFVLTLMSALIVDFVFYFKLEKVNMAEALKSVE